MRSFLLFNSLLVFSLMDLKFYSIQYSHMPSKKDNFCYKEQLPGKMHTDTDSPSLPSWMQPFLTWCCRILIRCHAGCPAESLSESCSGHRWPPLTAWWAKWQSPESQWHWQIHLQQGMTSIVNYLVSDEYCTNDYNLYVNLTTCGQCILLQHNSEQNLCNLMDIKGLEQQWFRQSRYIYSCPSTRKDSNNGTSQLWGKRGFNKEPSQQYLTIC